jgi:bacteriophage exclusion system BrxA-like protein
MSTGSHQREVFMPEQYRMSFTSADLKLPESLRLAEAYRDLGDWDAVRARVAETNLLQTRTASSARRYANELIPRLQTLSPEQLRYLIAGTHIEQRQLLWLAVCKRYAFIRGFATDILQDRYRALAPALTDDDFWRFFNAQADWHPELERLSRSTQDKVRQVLFRVLRQAGLIDERRAIIPVILSAPMVDLLAPDTPMSYQIYPLAQVQGS